jgi:hypothetical protein
VDAQRDFQSFESPNRLDDVKRITTKPAVVTRGPVPPYRGNNLATIEQRTDIICTLVVVSAVLTRCDSVL